jgi:hypothetical protein
MLNIFNSQNKIKEADLIIVNETGYQIYPNNTANVRRFFFLTEEGSNNLTYAYMTISPIFSNTAETSKKSLL